MVEKVVDENRHYVSFEFKIQERRRYCEVGFLEKFKGGFEQDIDDESEEDEDDEEGDGKCQLEAIGRRVKDTEKEARLQNSFPPVGGGNSFKPVARTTTNTDGTSTSTIPGAVTAEEKIQEE
ncbi:hypothetical protein Tco_0684332 [Tanacetum coccineum]